MSKPKFECIVSADLFRRAALAVSTEVARYYLNGVYVSAAPEGGAVLVATNGSFLIALHDPDGQVSGDGIVQLAKPMKAALKVSGVLLERRLLIARVTKDTQRAFVVDVANKGDAEGYSPYVAARELFDAPDARVQAAQFGTVTIDGKFPDWRRVLPSVLKPGEPISPIDQALVNRAAEALSMDRTARRVKLTSSGKNDPVLVTSTEDHGVSGFAVVMPLRHDDRAVKVPSWAMATVAEAA